MSPTGLSSLQPLTIERSLCLVDITYAMLRPWTTHTKHSQMCCWFSLSPEYDVHLNKMYLSEREIQTNKQTQTNTNKQTNTVRKRERERVSLLQLHTHPCFVSVGCLSSLGEGTLWHKGNMVPEWRMNYTSQCLFKCFMHLVCILAQALITDLGSAFNF